MKKEKVVVSRIFEYGKILENRFKDALFAVDGSVVRQVEVDRCRAEIATYNKMVDLLQGNPINKYDTRPDSYFVNAKVKDLRPINTELLIDAVAQSAEDHKRTMAFFDAINKEVKISGKVIAERMKGNITMEPFAKRVACLENVTRDDLEKLLPDYVSGGLITKLFNEEVK